MPPLLRSISMEKFRKHTNFWLLDGNVVLAVRESSPTRGLCDAHVIALSEDRVNSKATVLFRVHKGVLARNSAVFREMFTLRGSTTETSDIPINEEDIFEGLPLIRMQDSGEEIQALLEALYDPYPSKLTIRPSTFPFPILPLCNMAHKFQFDCILQSIVAQVVTSWPKNVPELDALAFNMPSANSLMIRDADPAAMLMFAERFNVGSVIPGALYRLSRARYSRDWTEASQSPGNLENPPPPSTWEGQVTRTTRRHARWNLLSSKCLLALARLKEDIDDVMGGGVEDPMTLDFGANSRCTNKTADAPSFRRFMDSLKRDYLVERDPLKALQNCMGSTPFNHTAVNLCFHCNGELGAQVARKREEIWGIVVKYAKDLRS